MKEAKCSICGGDFDLCDLYCALSGRGANSNCLKYHPIWLVCEKCGGFDKKDLKCPHCGSTDLSSPSSFRMDGKPLVIRQCHSCNRVFNPNGTKLKEIKEKGGIKHK